MKRLMLLFGIVCVPGLQMGPILAAQGPPEVVVQGPTVVAFFRPVSDAEMQKDDDINEALADFQLYASRVRGRFKAAGITFHELYTHSFRVRVGKTVSTFRPGKVDVGYYFVAPGKKPRVEYGVMTDVDLLQVANEYFGSHAK